jgi:hypothetical protein
MFGASNCPQCGYKRKPIKRTLDICKKDTGYFLEVEHHYSDACVDYHTDRFESLTKKELLKLYKKCKKAVKELTVNYLAETHEPCAIYKDEFRFCIKPFDKSIFVHSEVVKNYLHPEDTEWIQWHLSAVIRINSLKEVNSDLINKYLKGGE